jgi:hypothetical protein
MYPKVAGMLCAAEGLTQQLIMHFIGRHATERGEISTPLPVIVLLWPCSLELHGRHLNGDTLRSLFVGGNQLIHSVWEKPREQLEYIDY